MKELWRLIRSKLHEYRPEIKRYGIALAIIYVCIRSERYLAAAVVFVGACIMAWATTRGEHYRQIGEAHFAQKKEERRLRALAKQQGSIDKPTLSDQKTESNQ